MHWLGAERAIKLYRRFVPIKHSPFHSPAFSVPRDLRKLDQQRASIAFAALIRIHEQVLELKPGSSKPGGKIIKVNCEPNRRFSFKREKNFRRRTFPEQDIGKLLLRRCHLVWRALVPGQITNQLQNDRHILQARRTNLEFGRSLHFYFSDVPVHDGSGSVPHRTSPCPRPCRYENDQAFRSNDRER